MPSDIHRLDLVRVGLALAALGGVGASVATLFTVADGPGLLLDVYQLELKGGTIAFGITEFVLLALSLTVPWVWARLVGLGVAGVFLAAFGSMVIGAVTDGNFQPGVRPDLRPGGQLLIVAYLLTLVGIVVALVGFGLPRTMSASAVGGVVDQPLQPTSTSGKSVTALVLGILGLGTLLCAPLAVAFATMGLHDIRVGGGRIKGRGLAIAGLVLGIVGLAGWTLGLSVGIGFATP